MKHEFTLVFEPAEEGGFSAYVAEIPGVNTQGETMDEARKNVIEALKELLEYRRYKASANSKAVLEKLAIA